VPPLTGSLSTSIELRSPMADKADKRFRCSGGRLSGCVSGSIFFCLREELVSVEWRAKLREGRGCDDLASRDEGDSGRCAAAAFLEGDREAEVLAGAFVGETGAAAAAEPGCGSCCSMGVSGSEVSSSSPSTELGFLELFLPKNCFIEVEERA